jgi:hypothetical protein
MFWQCSGKVGAGKIRKCAGMIEGGKTTVKMNDFSGLEAKN